MHEIIVRRAEAADLPGASQLAGRLARMHHEANPQRFFLPDEIEQGYAWWFGQELARSAAVILVAFEGESLVGYAYGAVEDRGWNLLIDRHGVVHDIYVDDRARLLGVGSRLLDAMIRELEALGAPRIVLYTMVENERAQRLFRSRGFGATLLEMTRNTQSQK
jgi:ribosomal protein S18 acetylase RimI-like enzyme